MRSGEVCRLPQISTVISDSLPLRCRRSLNLPHVLCGGLHAIGIRNRKMNLDMAIKTTTNPEMTFTKGSGQPADKANRKTINPTRRSVTSRRAFHRGRLTLSIAWSNGLTKTVIFLKRSKSNCRFDRKPGNDGALLASIWTAGNSSANVATVATPGMTTSIPSNSRRSPNERRSRWLRSQSRSTGPSGACAMGSARSWEVGVGAEETPDNGGMPVGRGRNRLQWLPRPTRKHR
jgi:hypothetical protein